MVRTWAEDVASPRVEPMDQTVGKRKDTRLDLVHAYLVEEVDRGFHTRDANLIDVARFESPGVRSQFQVVVEVLRAEQHAGLANKRNPQIVQYFATAVEGRYPMRSEHPLLRRCTQEI